MPGDPTKPRPGGAQRRQPPGLEDQRPRLVEEGGAKERLGSGPAAAGAAGVRPPARRTGRPPGILRAARCGGAEPRFQRIAHPAAAVCPRRRNALAEDRRAAQNRCRPHLGSMPQPSIDRPAACRRTASGTSAAVLPALAEAAPIDCGWSPGATVLPQRSPAVALPLTAKADAASNIAAVARPSSSMNPVIPPPGRPFLCRYSCVPCTSPPARQQSRGANWHEPRILPTAILPRAASNPRGFRSPKARWRGRQPIGCRTPRRPVRTPTGCGASARTTPEASRRTARTSRHTGQGHEIAR